MSINDLDIDKILKIDEYNLSSEYSNQASLYAHFSTQCADAEYEFSLAEHNADVVYSQIDTSIRKSHKQEGTRVTEPIIKAMVISDSRYSDAHKAMIDAKHKYKLFKALSSALEQRAEMLISLGAHMRHEFSMTDMHINKNEPTGKL